ncbi:MAG: hypothetical protein ABIH36_01070 [bacterium]
MFEVPENTVGKKKRRALAVILVLVVAGLAAGASIVVFYVGGGEVDKLGEYFKQLPLTGEGRPQVADDPGKGQSGLPESGQTGEEEEGQIVMPTPSAQYNLAVTIQYRRQPNFTLEISNLERTVEKDNIQFYKVAEENPYSILQILDEQERVIIEEKFQVATEVLVDGLEGNTSPIYALEDSVSRFVLTLPPDSKPVKVRLITPRGIILNERLFSFDDLSSAAKSGLLKQIAGWLSWGRQALGATEIFDIVVISSVPSTPGSPPLPPDMGTLNAVANGVRGIMLSIDPWSVYASQVNVQVVPNVQDLGCRIVTFQGRSFPLCPNQDQIQQVLAEQGIAWDAVVIVVMNAPCNCGTSTIGGLMTAVGNRASGDLVAHEFGHGVAAMADEYYGGLGIRGPGGPNCFGSMEDCQGTLGTYISPGGICTQGCNNPDTVRPANLMMWNNLRSMKFGPVERCLMGKAIAAVLKETYKGDCGKEGPSDDSPKGPGAAPGWYKEY